MKIWSVTIKDLTSEYEESFETSAPTQYEALMSGRLFVQMNCFDEKTTKVTVKEK